MNQRPRRLAPAAIVTAATSLCLPAYASSAEPGPEPAPDALQPIVVTAQKSPVQRLIDRTVYEVSTDLQSTFLNLLVTELQNQDPTSPVDPTEMVGQMVSLNQLDQLMSINQTLDSMSTSSASASTSNPATANAVTALDSGSTNTASASPASAHLAGTTAATQQLPAYTPMSDPNALMNLYGSFGTPAATSSSSTSGGR